MSFYMKNLRPFHGQMVSYRAVMKTVTFKKADIPRLLINNRVILTDLQIDLT